MHAEYIILPVGIEMRFGQHCIYSIFNISVHHVQGAHYGQTAPCSTVKLYLNYGRVCGGGGIRGWGGNHDDIVIIMYQ